jgi:hypothetical protein
MGERIAAAKRIACIVINEVIDQFATSIRQRLSRGPNVKPA